MNKLEQRQLRSLRDKLIIRQNRNRETYENERKKPEDKWNHGKLEIITILDGTVKEAIEYIDELLENGNG